MSLEEKDLIKGLGQVMNQDTFRAVREKKSGLIQFNPVKMVNVCFAKHDKGGRTYMFINPSDQRLSPDTKIAVNTKYGLRIAYVVSSLKVQRKYLKALARVINNSSNKYSKVVGVFMDEDAETFVRLGGIHEQQSENRVDVQSKGNQLSEQIVG